MTDYDKNFRNARETISRVDKEIAKLDEKLKRLTRMRLEDEIPKESYLELKKEIEQEKIELINKRRILDAGMVPNEDGEEDPAKRCQRRSGYAGTFRFYLCKPGLYHPGDL